MSEPVSSMDVEDVLSSIRRLVSEEAKGNDTEQSPKADNLSSIDENIHLAAEDAARDALQDVARQLLGETDEFEEMEPPSNEFEADDDAPANIAQKLVLTEALRVSDKPTSREETPAVGLRKMMDAKSPEDEATVSEEASDEATEEVTAEASEASPRGANENVRPLRPSKFDTSPEDSLFERAKQAMDEAKIQTTRPARRVHFSRTEPDMVETGSMLAEDRAEVESTVEETPTEAMAEPAASDVATETAPEMATETTAETETSEESVTPDPSPFAEAEQGLADQAGEQIEDAEVVEEFAPEAEEDEAEEATTINFAEEDSILDEETLRDMVSELVRAELQGELGDRITRNVRKLVRREIQRALSTREFE